MGLIKEPKEVDLLIGNQELTIEQQNKISDYIQKIKQQGQRKALNSKKKQGELPSSY
jgi:hypothetical protein